jgi:methylthioribulose-1-phosphate dehydratase
MLDFPPTDFSTAAAEIIAAGKFLAEKGWAPATAGNYSVRLADGRIAITVSGYEKGELTPDAIMLIDKNGKPIDHRTPSA